MKPLDPRLLKYGRAARIYIIEIAVLGGMISVLVIAQAFLISAAASPVVTRDATLTETLPLIGALALVVAVRGGLMYLRESRAHRAADQTIAQLRDAVVSKTARLGPRWRAQYGPDTATLVTRGLDDLDPYFVRYLPQLIMVMTVTPIALGAILLLDFWSALVALISIPLIPLFMILIGRLTESASHRKLIAMERLGSQLLDILTGLPTLRSLGRERGPRKHLIELSAQNNRTTMQTLRIAFLSGGVLEFIATLAVALVAVEVGFRMVVGNLSLFTGLLIIMLAPEVFEPLRQVGAQFHASANGVAAANACFDILEQPEAEHGGRPAPDLSSAVITIEELSVAARGAWAPHMLSGTIEPGLITALSGASGGGKSTAVMVLLGLEPASSGRIAVDGIPVEDLDLQSWWKDITWVPQSPTIVAGTIRQNTSETAGIDALSQAANLTGFDRVVEELPQGWDTFVGSGGVGLSVGQRQRLALTRAVVENPELLVLDEPTAHLDAVSEEQIVAILKRLQQMGTTIVVIAHRQAVLEAADRTIEVQSALATEEEMALYPQLRPIVEDIEMNVELPSFLDPAEVKP